MTAYVLDVELKCALIDLGSSLNIMSLYTLEAMEVPRDRIMEQPIKVSDFRDNASFTLGYNNVDMAIEHMVSIHSIPCYRCLYFLSSATQETTGIKLSLRHITNAVKLSRNARNSRQCF